MLRRTFGILWAFLACVACAETRPQYVLLSPPAYTNAWQAYVDMRRTQRPDVDFTLVNAADIYAAHPFSPSATAGAPRNPAESIHAWIRARMAGITDPAARAKHYFVLGGSFVDAARVTSADDARLQKRIPGVFVRPHFAPDAVLQENEPYHPISDMFYACLDVAEGKWPWDGNANGKYADNYEIGDAANDYRADVIVARIPVEKHPSATGAQVIAAFTEKVRRVESPDFDGAYRIAAAGGQSDSRFGMSHARVMRDEREFYDGGLNQFDPRHGGVWVDSETLPRNTAKNMIAPRRPVLEGNPLFVYCWGSDHATIEEATAHYFSHDRDFVEYRDHGSAQDLYCKYINSSAYLAATGLTRMIFSGFSCMTGYIDGEGVSLAESEILSLNGGTVSSVHNSRYGIGTANVHIDDDGYSSTLQYYMKQDVLEQDMDMGSAWLDARQRYYDRGTASKVGRFLVMEQLLLGDPLIKLPPAMDAATVADTAIAVTKDTGYTTLTVPGGATISGDGLFKVMTELKVEGSGDLRFAADGGVGTKGVTFLSGHGKLTLASPRKGYFVQPTGADEVAIAGSGITLDLEQAAPKFGTLTLAGEGDRKTGNALRGRTAGQLAAFLPLTVSNTEVSLATVDAFKNATASRLATVSDGALGITTNPNLGLADCWEYLALPIALEDGDLFVDSTKTAGFGRPDRPGLAVSVGGTSSVRTMRGGRISLYGTTAFTLAADATLSLAAAFDPQTDGKVVIAGGTTVVEDETGLAGEVEVSGGTLVLKKIPLLNVTRLTLADGVRLVLPPDAGGFYQILQPQGATLVPNDATIATSDDPAAPIAGEFTQTCSFFDKSAFLVWNTKGGGTWDESADNQPWKLGSDKASYSAGMKVYFPDIAMALNGQVHTINLPAEINCDFANFGNQVQRYAFAGERLNLKNLQVGTDLAFGNRVYASAGALVTGGNLELADLNTPSLTIARGATVSAANLANDLSEIRGFRFVPLATAQSGNGKLSISELEFYNKDGKINLGSATVTEASGVGATSTNLAKAWDGDVLGINFMFAGQQPWSVSFADSSVMTSGRYYLQFMFDDPIPIITTYGVGQTYNNYQVESAAAWRIDVTVDGESWVTVARVNGGLTYPKQGTGTLWINGGAQAFAVNPASRTDVALASGGAYALTGTPKATFRFAADAELKVVPGAALQYTTDVSFIYPEEGSVKIVGAAADSQLVIANTGAELLFEDLEHFEAEEGYYLTVDGAGLHVVKGSPLEGPYTLSAEGRVDWTAGDWNSATGAFVWSESTLNPMVELEILPKNDLVLTINEDIGFHTLKAGDISMDAEASGTGTLRLEKTEDVAVKALEYDLSGFDNRVTVVFSTGAATVIAGKDTHLRSVGTGRLIVGEGMTVTIYASAWAGIVENNGGTVIYRTALPAPRVLFR